MLFPFYENLGWIFQKYDNGGQKKLIFIILTCEVLVQSKTKKITKNFLKKIFSE